MSSSYARQKGGSYSFTTNQPPTTVRPRPINSFNFSHNIVQKGLDPFDISQNFMTSGARNVLLKRSKAMNQRRWVAFGSSSKSTASMSLGIWTGSWLLGVECVASRNGKGLQDTLFPSLCHGMQKWRSVFYLEGECSGLPSIPWPLQKLVADLWIFCRIYLPASKGHLSPQVFQHISHFLLILEN